MVPFPDKTVPTVPLTTHISKVKKGAILVYFIHCKRLGAIKIGSTDDVQYRLKTLQTGCPAQLVLIGCCDDSEPALHRQFAHLRIRGEWFRDHRELKLHIKFLINRDKHYIAKSKGKEVQGYVQL